MRHIDPNLYTVQLDFTGFGNVPSFTEENVARMYAGIDSLRKHNRHVKFMCMLKTPYLVSSTYDYHDWWIMTDWIKSNFGDTASKIMDNLRFNFTVIKCIGYNTTHIHIYDKSGAWLDSMTNYDVFEDWMSSKIKSLY